MTDESSDPKPTSLRAIRHVPETARDGSPLYVLLHGRGSNERDLQGLVPHLPADAVVVTPQAPFPAAPWGYGPGWAWYRYLAGNRVVDETIDESLQALDGFLDELDASLPVNVGTRILGGFSQGGTTSLAWALTRPGRVSGVINLSGFLVETPSVTTALPRNGGLPVFWGHGRADPNIPFALGTEGREALVEAGAALEAFDHPGGHMITREELEALRRWSNDISEDGTAEG
jgi:phospholipase/carboxylesterase